MKKINSSLRVTELDTLSDVLVRFYKDASKIEGSPVSMDSNLLGIMAEVENLSDEITSAIKRDKISLSLDDNDIARDEVIRNLGDVLNGYVAMPIFSKKESAYKLQAIFAKYGRQIISKNYAEKSSLIESMIYDFSSESLKSDIANLEGVGELLTSLRLAQDSFNNAYDVVAALSAERSGSATDVKKSLLTVMNYKLVPYLTAVSSHADYKGFASKCETEIIKANSVVNSRKKIKSE